MNGVDGGSVAAGAGSGASAGAAFGPWGALAGGVIGTVGSLIGGSSAQKKQAEEALEMRKWAERMRLSNHQAEAADLTMAGLNRILTATGGSGATTPSAPMAQFDNYVPDAIGAGDTAAGMINSAKQAAEMLQQIKADTKLKGDQSFASRQQGILAANQAPVAEQDALKRKEEVKTQKQLTANAETQGKILQENVVEAQSSAARARNIMDIDKSELGEALRWIERFRNIIFGGGTNK